MRHLLALLVLIVAGCGVWALSDPRERTSALQLITHHGLRLGALVLIVLLLLAAAVYLPATPFL